MQREGEERVEFLAAQPATVRCMGDIRGHLRVVMFPAQSSPASPGPSRPMSKLGLNRRALSTEVCLLSASAPLCLALPICGR